jgi:Teichoic acid biosynthesis proteins
VLRIVAVFLFGGLDNVAQRLCERLNDSRSGMRCVGWLNPGFGTAEEMSTDAIINAINSSEADFLTVFLSAEKAQSWLMMNHDRLSVPVRGQFGATINYQAGTVRRAPVRLQRLGLEWLWRIKEEPYLWRRYFADGLCLIKLLMTLVVPSAFIRAWCRFTVGDTGYQLSLGSENKRVRPLSKWRDTQPPFTSKNRHVFFEPNCQRGRIF